MDGTCLPYQMTAGLGSHSSESYLDFSNGVLIRGQVERSELVPSLYIDVGTKR